MRVAGFATAIRRSLLPVVDGLARSHRDAQVLIQEQQSAEALALLWSTAWGLGVPTGEAAPVSATPARCSTRTATTTGSVTPGNRADEDVVAFIASLAGFEPRVTHCFDSLTLSKS